MTSDGRRKLIGAVASDESVGKVYIALGQDVRRCLICEKVFSRQGSFEHSKFPCHTSGYRYGEERVYNRSNLSTTSPNSFSMDSIFSFRA
jgi:hypothetical protein